MADLGRRSPRPIRDARPRAATRLSKPGDESSYYFNPPLKSFQPPTGREGPAGLFEDATLNKDTY
ncbi:hypothetical protein DFAR_1400002 [Desulfarculales bacterium]